MRFWLQMSLNVEALTDPRVTKLAEACTSSVYPVGTLSVEGCVVTELFPRHAQALTDFKVYDTDVWVASYPKCGKTNQYIPVKESKTFERMELSYFFI